VVSSLGLSRPPSSALFPYTTLFRSLDAEHRVGQRFGDHTFDLDDTVFLSHSLADASADRSICGGWVMSDATSRGHAEIRRTAPRSEEHTSELQSRENLVCRLLLEKK